MYLTSWTRLFRPEFAAAFNIFPGTGTTTIPLLGSLFVGWGFKFVVLLDNDDQGQNVRKKLEHELSIPPTRIVQPKDSKTIEDLLFPENFQVLLGEMDKALTLGSGERPSAAIKRQNIDKVLLARTYSERAEKIVLTKKSKEGIKRLLSEIWASWDK
jgi:hypothetical protein